MPGKKQLQKFSDDVLKIGDEVKVRAARGEKPAIFPVPPETPDVDDSQDFVLGMPDPEDESHAVPNSPDNDDIPVADAADAGFASDGASSGGDSDLSIPDIPIPGEEGFVSDIPDLSDILNSIAQGDSSNDEGAALDDVLGSVGDDSGDTLGGAALPPDADLGGDDMPSGGAMADDALTGLDLPPENAMDGDDSMAESDLPAGDLAAPDNTENIEEIDEIPEVLEDESFDASALNVSDVPDASAVPAAGDGDSGNEPDLAALGDISDFGPVADVGTGTEEAPETGDNVNVEPKEATAVSDLSDSLGDFDLPSETENPDVFGGDFGLNLGDEVPASGSDAGTESDFTAAPEADFSEVPDAGDIDFDALNAAPKVESSDAELNAPSLDESSANSSASDFASVDDFGLDDFGDFGSSPASDAVGDAGTDSAGAAAADFGDASGLDIPASDTAGTDDFDFQGEDQNQAGQGEENPLGDVDLSALDGMDFGDSAGTDSSFGDDSGLGSSSAGSDDGLGDGSENSNFEDIDIKDTDENFGSSGSDDDFELGGDDDFLIPGFSDTMEADFGSTEKKEVNPVSFSQSSSATPRDYKLTEEDYDKFKKNLAKYPLNVKLAIEEMIANNDFTEDVIFEVIEKVVKKTQARQLAIFLEKILDISLPVPRDFEHRTVEEYEAYKASFEYQLKNKIIPLTLIVIGLGLISTFLFMCGKHYIYRPLKAESLYRQGYALLQSDEYPQSEQKFKEAVHYRNSKKWFYKYARGYREHKQYERAAVMYDDILKRYKNDKPAGLEYAQMQWQDLSDYEGAVRILNDRMLMYHVNDPDGLLELGDIYLDWADNGETEMYENARLNYAALINLYGGKDLYMARMMRYFIRTDNLREVLQLKEIFFPKKKALGAQDLTELSGYMFDKMTGKLSANEAYLKDRIEDVKALMERAIEADSSNPTALYNMARYYLNMSNYNGAASYLDAAVDAFKKVPRLRKADVYRQIDSYRLKGELLVKQKEIIKAVETFTDGISTFKAQTPALPGNHIVGKLYADMADIDYFNFNNTDSAYEYYKAAIENDNDIPSIRYKIGAIQYEKGSFHEAMGSFMATAEFVPDDNNLLMALGNVLINRNSYSAAKGYYERLVGNLDAIRSDRGILMPQVDLKDQGVVDMYMKAANNLGVTLYHLAKRTGNSNLNAQAIINFTESLRAWDALTRNQESMKRLPGTNLAQENIQYVLKPRSNFEPAIYPDIPRTLSGEEKSGK